MSTEGMDVAGVRQMAGQLTDAAEEVNRIEQELTSGLEDVDWTGPDADQFRAQWSSEMVPALQDVARSLGELSETAERNAADQESTSGS